MASEELEPQDFEPADFEPAERVQEIRIGLAPTVSERALRPPLRNFADCGS